MEICEIAIDIGQKNFVDSQVINKVHTRLQMTYQNLKVEIGDDNQSIKIVNKHRNGRLRRD